MTAVDKDRIDHIAIPVDNIKQAVEWYTSQFNCKIKYQDETWAYLGFNNINLALVIPEQHPGHLAFIRKDAESYGTLKTHRDGTKSCYVKDPAGNSIEIMEPYKDD
ncbi:MAG: VOC family protein [Candidatus Obscuribacterales bacterium]|nr:VOC family protein [Candidatus Obscuribacterales bacterium]